MKQIITMALITLSLSSQAQYFRVYNNLSAASLRNEQFFSGIKTITNYSAGDSTKYYFVGAGVSRLNTALPAPDNVADRMRFTRMSTTGAVTVNYGFEFADTTSKLVLNAAGHSICDRLSTTGTGGFIEVGQVYSNTITGAAVAGGSDFLFTRLSTAGVCLGQYRYDLQGGYDVATCVRESKFASGKYLVCGYSNSDAKGYRNAFVGSINANGTVNWMRTYNFDATINGTYSANCMAFSLCENPKTGRIYVTGTYRDLSAVAPTTDGLIFALDNTGLLLWVNKYDTQLHDEFKSIRYSATNNLIVTGYTSYQASNFNTVLLKTDTVGNLLWRQEYQAIDPATNFTKENKGFDVMERMNTAGNLEYYISAALNITPAQKRAIVIKTDGAGLAPAQFTYDYLYTDTSMAIDMVPNWFAKPGLVDFANTMQAATGAYSDSYTVKAYFNGCTCTNNCPSVNITTFVPPFNKIGLPSKKATTFTMFGLNVTTFNYTAFTICNQAAVAGGNNARHEGIELSEMASINIFPVPAKDKITVEMNEVEDGNCTIEIYDMSGRKMFVTQQSVQSGFATFELSIDNLVDGLYILNIKNGNNELKKRFMKN